MPKSEAEKGDFAKIWQKLGGGGYSPLGSAAQVIWSLSFSLTSANLFFSNFDEICYHSLSFVVHFVSKSRSSKIP